MRTGSIAVCLLAMLAACSGSSSSPGDAGSGGQGTGGGGGAAATGGAGAGGAATGGTATGGAGGGGAGGGLGGGAGGRGSGGFGSGGRGGGAGGTGGAGGGGIACGERRCLPGELCYGTGQIFGTPFPDGGPTESEIVYTCIAVPPACNGLSEITCECLGCPSFTAALCRMPRAETYECIFRGV